MNGVNAITHIDNKILEELQTYSFIIMKNANTFQMTEVGKIVMNN